MMNFIHRAVFFMLRKIGLKSLGVLYRSSELSKNGWFNSFNDKTSIDSSGGPLPWFTYPAIDFIRNRIGNDISVFEYGSGAGTLWWATRVRDVVACENNSEWFQKVNRTIPTNVELFHVELEYGGAYSRKILDYRDRFDVIIIDGRDRVNCAINCLPALTESGVILFDDSDRLQYTKAYDFLKEHGFSRIEFMGMGPGIPFKFETSIFYRNHNIFGI